MDERVPKDGEGEFPVPQDWRPVIRRIVDRLVAGDFGFQEPLDRVEPVSVATAKQIREAIRDYGATLVALESETWDSSVAAWNGQTWDVLVDLWTAEEGCSDLVLHLVAREAESTHRFQLYLAYVP